MPVTMPPPSSFTTTAAPLRRGNGKQGRLRSSPIEDALTWLQATILSPPMANSAIEVCLTAADYSYSSYSSSKLVINSRY